MIFIYHSEKSLQCSIVNKDPTPLSTQRQKKLQKTIQVDPLKLKSDIVKSRVTPSESNLVSDNGDSRGLQKLRDSKKDNDVVLGTKKVIDTSSSTAAPKSRKDARSDFFADQQVNSNINTTDQTSQSSTTSQQKTPATPAPVATTIKTSNPSKFQLYQHLDQQVSEREGSVLELICRLQGKHCNATVKWTKNNQDICSRVNKK